MEEVTPGKKPSHSENVLSVPQGADSRVPSVPQGGEIIGIYRKVEGQGQPAKDAGLYPEKDAAGPRKAHQGSVWRQGPLL